jgi:hypothetical protein
MGDLAVTAPLPLSAADARRVERWFYIGVGLMMLLLNGVAFAPSLVDSSGRSVPLPLTPLVTAHVAVSVAWLLLFLLQAGLVATGRTHVHRRTAFGADATIWLDARAARHAPRGQARASCSRSSNASR